METHLPDAFRATPEGQEAEAILRACVHCGFCTATCPTYRLTGDEDDGPRGRIYLMKHALEQGRAGRATLEHLDRCLACRACETTCPSGVRYHRLLEITRPRLRRRLPDPLPRRWLRHALLHLLPERRRAALIFRLARRLRILLPRHLADHLPQAAARSRPPSQRRPRRVLLFQGCVEPTAMAAAHAATVHLLNHLGLQVDTLSDEGCCGALEHHLGASARARKRARTNLALWQDWLDGGGEAIVVLSSACLLQIREYPQLLSEDPHWSGIAEHMNRHVWELGQFLEQHELLPEAVPDSRPALSWHPPCTLQHGLGEHDTHPRLLRRLGHPVHLPTDAELCCGAAGSYTLLQAQLSQALGTRKRAALSALGNDTVVTANVGCLLQLQSKDGPRVRHWVEIVAEDLLG